MTGVQADVAEEREIALNTFCDNVKLNKERALYHLQDLRDYANRLAYDLAHRSSYDDDAMDIAERALKSQEWRSVCNELDDMAEFFEGIALDWKFVPADEFADEYEKVEIFIGDYELP